MYAGRWAVMVPGMVLVACWRLPRHRSTLLVWGTVLLAAMACLSLRQHTVGASAISGPAQQRASGHGLIVVRSDPRVHEGQFGIRVSLRADLVGWTSRGRSHRLAAPVLVSGPADWRRVPLGARVAISGRLAPSLDKDLAAVVSVRGPPRLTASPNSLMNGANTVRAGIRSAVADQPPAPRALVPALVDGDDGGLDPDLVEDFRTTGLTHLCAVSGTNLTLMLGFLLMVARGFGVQARGFLVVGALGVAGFVLLARTEPSVLRAAVMGSVALLGMGLGRAAGARALGVATTVLLLVDPWLSVSVGFVLSVCATAGILFLAPVWRDQLARWMPRWLAESISVPLAAQLACTPVIAAISGQVSLVAVLANLLVAAAVGPVTVAGLLGGVVACGWTSGGRLVALPGAWCARWIVRVAQWGADLPVPAVDVGTAGWTLVLLTLGCVLLAIGLGPLFSRRALTVVVCVLLAAIMLVPLPRRGWPPPGWIAVMCDVGQGDGLVIRTAPGEAMVVDAGPEPSAIDRCLDRLGVDRVSLVSLTHFHADHVGGLAGVLNGRKVEAIEVSPYDEPPGPVSGVLRDARSAGIPVRYADVGSVRTQGQVTWQVLAPTGPPPVGSDSPPNDASLVLLVRVRGVDMLLMGDEEEPSQRVLARTYPGLRADVLKVAHHGSAKQDAELIRSLGARLALVSVGVDNGYGHPAPSLRRLLEDADLLVRRTDQDGDIAVIERDGLRFQTSR